jgi:hypothetical protein
MSSTLCMACACQMSDVADLTDMPQAAECTGYSEAFRKA